MKIIIAGSRTITDQDEVDKAVFDSGWMMDMEEEVCGDARGVDTLGAQFAIRRNLPVKHFPADWNKFGRRAGYLRNVQMAEYADALILVWSGTSPGSKLMKDIATKKGIPIFERIVK